MYYYSTTILLLLLLLADGLLIFSVFFVLSFFFHFLFRACLMAGCHVVVGCLSLPSDRRPEPKIDPTAGGAGGAAEDGSHGATWKSAG